MKYIISIDQSTSGTKAILFDEHGKIISRKDISHKQIHPQATWVEHDPTEIFLCTLKAVKETVQIAHISKSDIVAVGISNQRETALVWDKKTGVPIYNAIVWQCARGKEICESISDCSNYIKKTTGLNLSPYFSAAKISWILKNIKTDSTSLCCGTIDSWLVYNLTNKQSFKTDYSNASRTQLLNLKTLTWDNEICKLFSVDINTLPEICDSDALFGYTDFNGFLDAPIPINSVMGDSHAALFGQGCLKNSMAKVTYGTGSSVMINSGKNNQIYEELVTSIGWKINGELIYVCEGNINYSGAVIKWLQEKLNIISQPQQTQALALKADPQDTTYIVPAFSGLGAPYWVSNAKAMIYGMSLKTGVAEITKAALESIAYQINDIVELANALTGKKIELRADGGATKNEYLMQLQSNILNSVIYVTKTEELSACGAAFAAGLACNIYSMAVFETIERTKYEPHMADDIRQLKLDGWQDAISRVIR